MRPIRLYIKDFCAHQETEFSFDDFSSALVIGKVKNNDRFSNGAGKSTVFNAIEYVLFNEVHFSALEKVIRDGCDVCRVEFDFQSSLDKCIYRIVRSNARRAGTDIRLSKKLEDGQWIDQTQRRVSDTEKEIVKIVGFNYKAFCASVLFSQAGSENNIQKDFGNLPFLTPERRKSILREVLQLNVYSGYEKLAKSKYNALETNLEKHKVRLQTLETSEREIRSLTDEHQKLVADIADQTVIIHSLLQDVSSLNEQYILLSEQFKDEQNHIQTLNLQKQQCITSITRSSRLVSELEVKIGNLPNEAKQITHSIEIENVELAELQKQNLDPVQLHSAFKNITDQIVSNRSACHVVTSKIGDLNTPITDHKVCAHCHQVVSESHKKQWAAQRVINLQQLQQEYDILNKDYRSLQDKEKLVKADLAAFNNAEKRIDQLQRSLVFLNKELSNKRSLYAQYKQLVDEHSKTKTDQQIQFDAIEQKLAEHNQILHANKLGILQEIKTQLNNKKQQSEQLSSFINAMNAKIAVIEHKLQVIRDNQQQAIQIKADIQGLEKSLLVHSKVIQAFGSGGIPALITHSILDDLQTETNKWLIKLRPGLQLQFVVVNDKTNKEKEDTLEILYFIDGNQREYKQLSGAQKIIVSLSIKLGLLFIMNKRLGVDIKLVLLDEVDQSLDSGSIEVFADIIRIIQEEFKVMVITHSDDLKHKFSHAILVEQDENNVSHGKLINW